MNQERMRRIAEFRRSQPLAELRRKAAKAGQLHVSRKSCAPVAMEIKDVQMAIAYAGRTDELKQWLGW